MAKLTIKSVGFIDGEWKVNLSNGDEIGDLSAVYLNKTLGQFGELEIKIIVDKTTRFDSQLVG